MPITTKAGEYSLATGEAAVRRLSSLHRVCSPAGRRILLQAGLKAGMHVADFGCGIGATTRMLAEIVGPSGHVTGIDINASQLEQACVLCKQAALPNTTFVESSATDTGLPHNSFDLVYCRFLLLHLTDPAAGLREMLALLKPGGVLVVEDGDLTTAGSVPPSSLHWFATLFGRLGPARGLDYSLATRLFHLVKEAGISEPEIEMQHVTIARGEDRFLVKWTVEEAAPAFVSAGLVTPLEMDGILADMERDTLNLDILPLGPRMSYVWGRKPSRVLED